MENVTKVIQLIPLNYYILLSTLLFSIGVIGVLFRRNAIVIFMCIELMLNAVNLLLAAFSSYRSDPSGQVFVFFIMAVAVIRKNVKNEKGALSGSFSFSVHDSVNSK